MLTREKLLEFFRKYHALQRGHFELSSGLHSGHYFQCAQVLQHPEYAMRICGEFVRRFKAAKPTIVIGPAVGGVVLAYETARGLKARALYSERVDAEMQLRRGFTVGKRDRVLITEDAITTGESSRKVASLVKSFGAKVIGIAAVVDRSGGKVKFEGYRFFRLFALAFETFPPSDCPLCGENIPVTRPGRLKQIVL